jgi:hypothetical protein
MKLILSKLKTLQIESILPARAETSPLVFGHQPHKQKLRQGILHLELRHRRKIA